MPRIASECSPIVIGVVAMKITFYADNAHPCEAEINDDGPVKFLCVCVIDEEMGAGLAVFVHVLRQVRRASTVLVLRRSTIVRDSTWYY